MKIFTRLLTGLLILPFLPVLALLGVAYQTGRFILEQRTPLKPKKPYRAWDGATFENHECVFCKRDPDASYCVPPPDSL